jgi:hypothetical protein
MRKERVQMTKITKKVLARIWWLGRGTATMMGLAVLLALTVGLASTAMAGTGVGARFDLGKINTVNALTSLVGSVAGPSLKIDNNSAGTGATALRLEVEPGKPPMSVNSTTEVQGLNVDSLDSKNSSDFLQESSDRDDFLPSKSYEVRAEVQGKGGGQFASEFAECDPGDHVLSGGYISADLGDHIATSTPGADNASNQHGWFVFYDDFNSASSFTVMALCADYPPLR